MKRLLTPTKLLRSVRKDINLVCGIPIITAKKNKLGLSWGSTRLRQLAWSYPTKLNIVFNIGLNMELNIGFNTGFNIGFNIGVQYWV